MNYVGDFKISKIIITEMKNKAQDRIGLTSLLATFALAVAVMSVITSCDKEKSIITGAQGEKITLTATVEQSSDAQAGSSQSGSTIGTKTILDADGAKVNWQVGDVIKIYSTVSGALETTGALFTTVATGTKGPFTGTLVTGGAAPFYAYYPEENITSIDADGTMTITLPSVQTYKANSFGKEDNPAVAYSADGTTLAFKNLCGMVKLNLYSATALKVRSISLMNISEKLSGTGTVTVNKGTGIPTLTMKTDRTASNYVKLDCSERGVALSTDSNSPTVFYIVVPPSKGDTYGYQVSIEFTEGEEIRGYMSKSATIKAENKIERNNYRNMPTFSAAISTGDYISQSFDYGAGTTIGSTTWSPVNCGFHATNYKYGKLYQWGRKDGQGYDDNDAIYPTGNNISSELVALSTADASKFYTKWSNTIAPNGIWGTSDPWNTKNIANDPCPTGWRVPNKTELTSLSASGVTWRETNSDGSSPNGLAGIWFGTNHNSATAANPNGCLFLPAAGMNGDDGAPSNRNGYGFYWSSTPVDVSANYLFFYNNNSAFLGNDTRAYGMSVRCVKE